MREIRLPHEIGRRAWERAYMLTQDFSDRLTLEQLVRMHVVLQVGPERLGWAEAGDCIAVWSSVVEVRV